MQLHQGNQATKKRTGELVYRITLHGENRMVQVQATSKAEDENPGCDSPRAKVGQMVWHCTVAQ